MNSERNIGLDKIAEISGLPVKKIKEEEVLTLYYLNRKPSFPRERRIIRKYFPKVKPGSRRYAEQRARFATYAEAWLDIPSEHINYATFIPSYWQALKAQERFMKRTHTLPRTYKALLLGSLSKLTTEPFEATTRAVFPKSASFIIDLKGEETTSEWFSFANALKLPFADSTFHSVQTNSLLRMLRGRKDTSHEEDVRRLCREAYRVLMPGGMLMMAETDREAYDLEDTLREVGFSKLMVRQPIIFATSQITLEFLEHIREEKTFSLGGDLEEREVGNFVLARKPK